MKFTPIKTKQLILRKPRMSDARIMVPFYNDRHASRFTRIPYPYKLRHAKKHLEERISKFGKTGYDFLAFTKKTNELVGSIGFIEWNKADNNAEIGYFVTPAQRNKGYATEACRAVVDFGFKKMKLHRITIGHAKGNKASQKVIKKIRAKYEGTLREFVRTGDGKYKDSLRYSILAREWKNKK